MSNVTCSRTRKTKAKIPNQINTSHNDFLFLSPLELAPCLINLRGFPPFSVLSNSAKKEQGNCPSMAAQALASSFRRYWDHDVFLSFRGVETRTTFTDHLYRALLRIGIRTFRDEDELPKGENISEKLINAIHGSRISIVVFSKGYAFSRWCLDELVEIVDCTKTRGHTLIPIFYHVEPSDVRKQKRTFASAFAGCEGYEGHETRFQANMERVERWREALCYAGNCAGWNLNNGENRHESELIEKVVAEVFMKVKPAGLHVARYSVGLDSRVKQMKDLLNLEAGDVRIIGIYGMCGIGKTTLAKAVYNEICDGFEGSCFLSNIKDNSERCEGVVRLQEQLLSNILKTKNLKIDDIDGGIKLIEERLQGKKVLVVLDDVEDMKQVYNLVQTFEWFGSGSRVIATTTDEHFLTQLRVNGRYKVEILDPIVSLELFSLHAFRLAQPREGYRELSTSAVNYAGGHPLALEVLGSFLSKRTIDDWKDGLKELQRTPDDKIQRIFRISYESLNLNTKNIFLDIACFFIDMEKEHVIEIFKGRGFTPGISIDILINRSLLTIDYYRKFRMHDLARDVGREIVREESFRCPGKRSRLWFHEDALNVLRSHTGTDVVEGLALDTLPLKEEHFQTEAFSSMKNLQLLQINGVHINGCFERLSRELRWLSWHKCPLKFLPPKFHLEHLVVLEMQYSSIKQLWKKNNIVLNKLKVLDLSYSKNLTKSPNFLQVPNLAKLNLEGCTNLVELHESIGHLKGLVWLNLRGCEKLRNVLRSISKLESLRTLHLSGCLKFDEAAEKWGDMILASKEQATNIITFYAGNSNNLGPLSTLLRWESLESLSIWLSHIFEMIASIILNPNSLLRGASHFGFRTLDRLVLRNHNFSEDQIPIELESISSLRYLDLSKNNFSYLPDCVNRLPRLKILVLKHCVSLRSISQFPANIGVVMLTGCSSMERLSIQSNTLVLLYVSYCCKLVEIEGLNLESVLFVVAAGCHSLSSDFRNRLLQLPRVGQHYITLSGSEIPNWFTHKRNGPSISFRVPSLSVTEIHEVHLCAVYGKKTKSRVRTTRVRIWMQNKTRGYGSDLRWPRNFVFHVHDSDNLIVLRLPILENMVAGQKDVEMTSGEEFKVSFKVEKQGLVAVKKCGVYFHAHVEVYEGDTTTDEEVSESDHTTIDDDEASQSYGISSGEVSEDDTTEDEDEVSQDDDEVCEDDQRT